MKTGYYTATTSRGVEYHGDLLERDDVEICTPKVFYNCLFTLTDEEEIFTFMDMNDEEIYTKILEEYGIQGNYIEGREAFEEQEDKHEYEKMLKRLIMIAEDMEQDAKDLAGKPFNGRTIGKYFGYQGAAIAALANTLRSLINHIKGDSSSPKGGDIN